MHFHTFEFACFLTAVTLLVFLFRASKLQKLLLIVASYWFYSWDHFDYLWLLVYSTCLDFYLGQKISQGDSKKKFYLMCSLVGNLGLLCYFKYLGFFNELLLQLGGSWSWSPKVLLPIGISFYTFQTMSYSIDVYREKIKPCTKIVEFGLYVSFFPQLIAGPIVRASEFLPQLKQNITFDPNRIRLGVELLIMGLFKKSMGDILSFSAGNVSTMSDEYTGWWVLYYMYATAIHIYLDFSGYSDMAIGMARLFGLELPENFRFPYLAKSFGDLWKRWHITLSSWMKDYLYIPLGGNRCSMFRQTFNLMVTMTLSGLWHGAAMNFMLWGFLHGALLVFERSFVWKWIAKVRLLSVFFVFHCTAALFVLFQIEHLWLIKKMFKNFFEPTQGVMTASMGLGVIVLLGTLAMHVLAYRDEYFYDKILKSSVMRTALVVFAFALALVFVKDTPHVYFRF